MFGLNDMATLGIDEALNEQQISSIIAEPIDFKILLRDGNHPHHSQNLFVNMGDPINFNVNADLKIDSRPIGTF
jgi:hypothetical protein